MKDVKIICIVGMPGSGKGTISNQVESLGHPVVHFGNMVYDEVRKRGLDEVKDEVFVRHDMRRIDGPEVMAIRASEKADEMIANGTKIIIFDGLYSWTEYKFLESKYGESLKIIAVVAPREARYQRVLKRKDTHRKYSREQLLKREIDEIENMEKGGPIAYADMYINNSGSLIQFHKEINNVLSELGL